MADPAFIAALIAELTLDPATLGYSAPPAQWQDEAAALVDLAILNTKNRTVGIPTLSASQLFEAIDEGEWSDITPLITSGQKDNVRLVLSLGDNIQVGPGTKARAILLAALSTAPLSVANLAAIASKQVTRAEELGFSGLKIGHIQLARREA